MRRSCERAALALALAGLIAACGGEREPAGAAPDSAGGLERAEQPSGSAVRGDEPERPAARARPAMGGRTRELVNPEPLAVVLLHHDLAGTEPPFARWIEADYRVISAPAIEKPAQRDALRAEFEAALAAVRGVGALRLSLGADLSDYDPTYGEFTVRALAPSRVVTFDALGEHVELRFANGLDAQVWRVPAEDAQLVRDKVAQFRGASLDVLLRILELQPGGTIVCEIAEYELRVERTGERLARVRVTQ